MSTEDELLRLAGDGVAPWEHVWVAHYFSYLDSTGTGLLQNPQM